MFSENGQDVRDYLPSMRKISLVRLQRQLELLQLRGELADEAMQNLAGMYRIQCVGLSGARRYCNRYQPGLGKRIGTVGWQHKQMAGRY